MRIVEHVELAPLTTFKIGGSAKYFAEANNIEDIQEGVAFAKKNNLSIFVLGGGSNVLISDDGFPGLVIKNKIRGIFYEENSKLPITNYQLAKVGGGENWDGFVVDTVKKGLWGIENLSGIPGTVGAAPIQNIGAYGMEVKDVIEQVEAIDLQTGEVHLFTNSQCIFAYRDSFFKKDNGKHFCVTRVIFRLSKEAKPNLTYKDLKEHFSGREDASLVEIRDVVLSIRAKKFPNLLIYGTAGSFWKNPIISEEKYNELKQKYPDLPGFPLLIANCELKNYKIPLAWILDSALHLKGYEKNNVRLFEKQPIVVVTEKDADKKNVESLACDVEKKVLDATGIEIEREVLMI